MRSLTTIVHRELLLASRRPWTYWARMCTAALVGTILFALALSARQPGFMVSSMIFWALKVLLFVYCALAGVRYTSDALSREAREGTLGLLFLTDLRGYDVVLGKMVITSLSAFFNLLAALPLLAVPVMVAAFGSTAYHPLN